MHKKLARRQKSILKKAIAVVLIAAMLVCFVPVSEDLQQLV